MYYFLRRFFEKMSDLFNFLDETFSDIGYFFLKKQLKKDGTSARIAKRMEAHEQMIHDRLNGD